MADFRMEDLEEPFQGVVDEFMKLEEVGVVNYVDQIGGSVEDMGMRLTEGFDNLGDYFSDTMFANAGTGVRDTLDHIQKEIEGIFVNPLKELSDLGGNVTKVIDNILAKFFGEFPADIRKGIAETIGGFLSIPQNMVDELAKSTPQSIAEFIVKAQLFLAAFPLVPVKLLLEFLKKLGIIDEKFGTEANKFVNRALDAVIDLFTSPLKFFNGLKDEALAKSLQMIPQVAREFIELLLKIPIEIIKACLLYTSPSPRDKRQSRMPSSA